MNDYQIVTYQDDDVTLDVRVDVTNQTIWMSVNEICILYKKSRTTINHHIRNISSQFSYKNDGTLSHFDTMCLKNSHVLSNRKRGYATCFYNLDLIIEIGTRIKSNKGLLIKRFLSNLLSKNEDNSDNSIIIYNNGYISLDVRVSPSEDTVWLSKEQLMDLFDSTRQNIEYHISNIYEQNELDKGATCKEILQVQHEGDRTVNRMTSFYNLDLIISLGYRVNTLKGIAFRKWATSILKRYLLQGYAIDSDRVLSARNIVRLENEVERIKNDIKDIKEKMFIEPVKERIFYNGQFFDAYELVTSIIKKAKEEIIIVDPYFDIIGLSLLEKSPLFVKRIIVISMRRSHISKYDIKNFKKEYGSLEIIYTDIFHDRYLIIDKKEAYSLGTSLNGLGKRVSSISQITKSESLDTLLKKISSLK